MLIAICLLVVVIIVEAYIIAVKEARICELQKRLFRQIRMTDAWKNRATQRRIITDVTFHHPWGVEMDEERKEKIKEELMKVDKEGRFIPVSMPIEMTEVK